MTNAERALAILEPHFDRFRSVIMTAWDRYLALPAEARLSLLKSARAAVVHSFMIAGAIAEFDGVDGVTIIDGPGCRMVNIDNLAIVRFKRHIYGLTRNYPTLRAKAFQSAGELLDGLPVCARFDAGYELNYLETAIESVRITSFVKPSVPEFYFELMPQAQQQLPFPQILPERRRTILEPKEGVRKEHQDGTAD